MASIARDKNGRKRVLFFNGDGQRKSIRLGKMAVKQAETVKLHIEHLVAAATTGTAPDPKAANWIAELGDDLHAKLAGHGLVTAREHANATSCRTLAEFIDGYIAMRTDVKPATVVNWGHTRRNLVEFFGAGKPIAEVTPGCADEWRISLVAKGLADGTIRKRCGNAKQFFANALRKRLLPCNPFADLPSNVQGNRERDHFVSKEVAQRVLDACPDAEWRLLFALSRYGGLRCPSEHLALRWGGVDWERGRILVPSPKTERHENKGSRWIPIFPELRPHLEQVFDLAPEGSVHVIARYRDPAINLRTRLLKIIQLAGENPWPKLWQNLRASRETELAETYPLHVTCAWIGHSQAIAAKHYLQVTEDHFQRAIAETPEVAQNAAQSGAVSPRTPSQGKKPDSKKTLVLQGFAAGCELLHNCSVGTTELESVTSCMSSKRSNQLSYAP